MPYSSRPYVNRYIPSNRFPVGLRWLLVVNIAVFIVSIFSDRLVAPLLDNFALVPAQVVQKLAVWQLVTYMFLHAGFGSILWNMLALWLFGAEMERLWGTAKFLRFYFLCGIFAALCVVACAYIFGGIEGRTVGSSGAIYGLLVAYGLMFPEQTILFSFLIPIKSKYFVMIIGAIVFLQSYMVTMGSSRGSGVAAVAGLGGFIAGYLLIRGRRLRTQLIHPLDAGYKEWKLRRARKKFEVYLRKTNSDRNRRVH